MNIQIYNIKQIDDNTKGVKARDLYAFLGLDKTHYNRWVKEHIEKNKFCMLNADYITVSHKGRSGNNPNATITEHYLTLNFAKKLAMMSKSPKGEQVRDYFIECEKRLKQSILPFDLADPISVLDYAKEIALEAKALKAQNEKLNNKINLLTHIRKTFTTTEIAKELGLKSGTALNNKLSDKSIQYKQNGTWILYSKYSDLGYCSIKEEVLDSGRVIYNRRWTNEGRSFILELLGNQEVA